ncbi:MAG: hypothetical protein JO117_04815 [Verrucomicrobia bacterium]|nr:hypothetical protein [Verrucomicrobiota bacterium]MBV9659181.1 hypothetical protein [Verrucomicrobiota bacterium]
MKRKFLTCLLASLALFNFGFEPNADASVAGARLRAYEIAAKMRAAGYTFVDGSSGLLRKGEISGLIKASLIKGNTYALVAGGCEDAYDVDVIVYDENGNVIGEDSDTAPVAVVENITPAWTGDFFVRVRMYDCTSNGAHYVLLLGRK